MEVLGDRFSAREVDFFTSGGTSMDAALLVAKLFRDLDVRATLQDILLYPLLSDFVRQISRPDDTAGPSVDCDASHSPAALTFPQARAVESDIRRRAAGRQSRRGNVSWACYVDGVIDLDRLKRALYKVAKKHRILRSFIIEDALAVNSVTELEPDLRMVRLEHDDTTDLMRVVTDHHSEPLDYRRAPCWTALYVSRPSEHGVLSFSFQHLISDGGSVDVFMAELAAAYGDDATDHPAARAELTAFGWARRQSEWLSSLAPEDDFRYCDIAAVKNFIPPLDLDIRAGTGGAREIRSQTCVLNVTATGSVREEASNLGATPFQLLALGYGIVIDALRSFVGPIAIATPHSNRSYPGSSGIIGWIAHVIPIRFTVKRDASFVENLRLVSTALGDAVSTAHLPLRSMADNRLIDEGMSYPQAYLSIDGEQEATYRFGDGVELRKIKTDFQPTATAGLSLIMSEDSGGQIDLVVVHRALEFDESQIENIPRGLETVLTSIVLRPDDSPASLRDTIRDIVLQ